MAIKALGPYDFPSADRQENFGDDMLVHVMWANNMMFAAAACFRAPRAMAWGDFKAQMVDPWAASDPDYDPATPADWRLDGEAFMPHPDKTLADLGVGHKGLISFRT
jgi:phenol hydroxylase P4 protein